jgi:hypothetical protein
MAFRLLLRGMSEHCVRPTEVSRVLAVHAVVVSKFQQNNAKASDQNEQRPHAILLDQLAAVRYMPWQETAARSRLAWMLDYASDITHTCSAVAGSICFNLVLSCTCVLHC